MAKPTWIIIDPTTGSNNGEVEATAPVYTGRNSRTGTITATTAGDASDTTSVTQKGKAEFITVDSTTGSIGNTGGDVLISGTSNSANLKIAEDSISRIDGVIYTIEVNEVPDESWDGDADTGIDGDPGASAQFTFKVTAAISANHTTSARTHKVTITNAGASVSSSAVTITQAAGVKTYATPVISTFTYPSDIPAEGGSVTPTAPTYSQTWGWNGATTGGGTITTDGTLTYSGTGVDASTGAVSGEDLETTEKERTLITTASVTVSLNGKTSAAKTAQVYQEANVATYGDVTITGGTVADIPASGGTRSTVSGYTTAQTVSYTSGATRDGEIEVSYDPAEGITGADLGTTIKSRTLLGNLTLTATGEGGESAEKEYPVYQAANAVTNYGDVVITATTPVALAPAGATYDLKVKVTASQTLTFTSGDTKAGEIDFTYTQKTAATGFSLSDGVVTVTENPGTTQRGGYVVTVKADGEGDKTASKDITFNQQGSESYITVSPETLTFEAAGGTQTITINSNDSWTIS